MKKWYEEDTNHSSILSSRVRLARNFKDHKFPNTAGDRERLALIEQAAKALAQHEGLDSLGMIRFEEIHSEEDAEKLNRYSLVDKHLISPELAAAKKPACAFISQSEKASIMLMEEDHVRIQAVESGDNIEGAYENAAKFDDLIDKEMEYAFDAQWGYLTSCPSNAGTGMRASYMLHLPYLEALGQIGNVANSIGKFGYTLRGTFGEGTNSYGSVYQISNQITMGLKEEDVLASIGNLAAEIVEKEKMLRQREVSANRLAAEDSVWRVYGVLTNARQMTEKEAITNLSLLKTGIMAGVIDLPLPNIYDLIINIRTATLSKSHLITDRSDAPKVRAEYLRKRLGNP